MATAIHREARLPVDKKDQMAVIPDIIPDIVEDRKKDSEGRLIVTKYERGKLLGKGGFAKCYLGLHIPTKQQFALKIVAKSSLTKSRAKQKLQTEIKIHRTLRHPNVVKFERFFEDQVNAYMLLELCHNNSMSEMLKRRKRLTEPETRYYLCQLISSLQYLHQNLVIHRDLKLGNLFLDADMRIKVGDFGLATRLSHADERRKTVCGTPNYIAPEILEGKDGHSFQVDVWSTGVIMYTLLVGKPPFESENVKATYKRILANTYSFPDHIPICEHAKSLIRSILQTRPDRRPSLEVILEHSFFTRASAYTPPYLPSSALREAPALPVTLESMKHRPETKCGGDENDPNAINRASSVGRAESANRYRGDQALKESVALAPSLRARAASGSAPMRDAGLAVGSEVDAAVVDDVPTQRLAARRPQTSRPSSIASASALPGAAGRGVQPLANSSDGPISALANPSRPLVLPAPLPKRDSSAKSQGTSALTSGAAGAASHDRRGYSQKFEIFQDQKVQPPVGTGRRDAPAAAESLAPKSSSVATAVPNGGLRASIGKESGVPLLSSQSENYLAGGRDSDTATTARAAVSLRSRTGEPTVRTSSLATRAVDQILSGMQDMQLTETRSATSLPTASSSLASGSAPGLKRLAELPAKPAQEAWGTETSNAKRSTANASVALNSMPAALQPPQRLPSSPQRNVPIAMSKPQPANESEPMQVATPPDHIVSSKDKPLGTLEAMHEVLSSGHFDDLQPAQPSTGLNLHQAEFDLMRSPSKQRASVWVVRYVDYTSKYGLGFLLNTGSAGVYFNDSTKIVLAPDGVVFQYIERRRKEGSPSAAEHSTQTHLITAYPVELQKKVTLLRHFRNYLVEQQRACAQQHDDGTTTGDGMQNMPMVAHDAASSGASALVKFGVSSAQLRVTDPDAMELEDCRGDSPMSTARDDELPFLKKWVRTRHAILFRLSNRTVQVVFFDRTEILLSSEARMVTYVDKQGSRSEHSLDEVIQTGRTDISKRLKYAKDIMYRLINIQK